MIRGYLPRALPPRIFPWRICPWVPIYLLYFFSQILHSAIYCFEVIALLNSLSSFLQLEKASRIRLNITMVNQNIVKIVLYNGLLWY